jgi:hypothetical protein
LKFLTFLDKSYDNMLFFTVYDFSDELMDSVNPILYKCRIIHQLQSFVVAYSLVETIDNL